MWAIDASCGAVLTVIGLHIPTFMRQCNDLWAIPRDEVVNKIALPFLGLYLAVCTVHISSLKLSLAHTLQLGLQFMDPSEVSRHFTLSEVQTLPDLWFNGARSVSRRDGKAQS